MNYEQSARAQTERLMADGHATILAIESSCDETAAAIVRDGRQVISSVISSQIPLHAMYGGVVPEIASRAHVESVDPVVDEALKKAGMTLPMWTRWPRGGLRRVYPAGADDGRRGGRGV